MSEPFAFAVNALHDPSGVGVSPVRTLIVRLVPVGVASVHEIVLQVTCSPASKTRESKVHGEVYGLMRSQSIVSSASGPGLVLSLATGRMFEVGMPLVWVATKLPST